METFIINRSVYSPPVKWNCITGGGGIFGFAKNLKEKSDDSNSITTTDTTSYVEVGEIWNADKKVFEEDNLNKLLGYIAGKDTSSVSDLNGTTLNSAQMRTSTNGGKASGKDIIVTLAGKRFEVVYLSPNDAGEPVVTLWEANNSTTSRWSGSPNVYSSYFNINYPTSMYGTSYIRAVTLNNGGDYVSAISNADSSTATSTLSTATQSSSNTYAAYTMRPLANFIVEPSKMPYMTQLDSKKQFNFSYSYPNEATQKLTSPKWSTSNSGAANMESNSSYFNWINDKIWLPSLAETGYSDTSTGVWNTSNSQRRNSSYSWLRSGAYSSATSAYYLNSSGANFSLDLVTYTYAVRPALHLNLRTAASTIPREFILDINANKDGVYLTEEGNNQDPEGYATFDLYLNGVCVANDVGDYYNSVTYGTSYEIRDIKLNYDKAYEGVFLDGPCTNSTSLSGTMPAERLDIFLKLRTKTWNDYAASSFASGNGTAASPYIIKTAEQLAKVAVDSRSSTLSGKCYKLGADIDLSAHVWEGIGSSTYTFAGNFNGNLHVITKIKTSQDCYVPSYMGFFNFVVGANISNVIITNSNFTGVNDGGAIVANGSGSITNCVVSDTTITNQENSIGGIAGYFENTIQSCLVKNVTLNGCHVGGILGWSASTTKILDSMVMDGTITASTEYVNMMDGHFRTGEITACYGLGTINGTNTKLMYGDSSAWGNWTYNANLNGGYPVQKPLFHIGGVSGSENVYNYLLNKLNLILDMDKYMAWTNEQLAAHSRTQYNMTKDAEGVYAWSGDSGGYTDNGFHSFYYNPGTLVTGGTYRLSYQSKNTRTDSNGTTCIFIIGSYTTVSGGITHTNSQEWKTYEETFTVTDANSCTFAFGYSYGDLTYFKDIRLERLS